MHFGALDTQTFNSLFCDILSFYSKQKERMSPKKEKPINCSQCPSGIILNGYCGQARTLTSPTVATQHGLGSNSERVA